LPSRIRPVLKLSGSTYTGPMAYVILQKYCRDYELPMPAYPLDKTARRKYYGTLTKLIVARGLQCSLKFFREQRHQNPYRSEFHSLTKHLRRPKVAGTAFPRRRRGAVARFLTPDLPQAGGVVTFVREPPIIMQHNRLTFFGEVAPVPMEFPE
jgi:hypothetical protein